MAEVADKAKKEDPSVVAKADAKLEHPSNLCCYSQRVCHLEKLKGFDFCHKHILEDKASPFKPCDFVAKSNGRRCPNPAPKVSDRGKSFCIVHTRKAELRRAVEERRKRRHHEGDGEEGFDGDKEKRRRTSSSNSQKSDKPDGHSSDEEAAGGSGEDFLKVDSAWHGDLDSDADSVDSEEEDPLKHAGVWTVEETTRMCRDKMIRLRSLYIAQFKRLQHVLKERKRKYCQAIQAEEEEETGECHLTPTQLLGHKRQHERPGTEALLHKQAKEKKQGLTTRPQGVSTLRCTYSPGGNRCAEKVVPLTKHCMKHITHDPNQLLFQKCTFTSQSDSQCERSIAKIFNHTFCRLHLELPPKMKRPDVKKDLEDAKERAKFRKARALEQKDKSDLPDAVQQKSSTLVPPTPTSQLDDTVLTTTQPSQATKPSHSSLTGNTSQFGEDEVKKIDVNVGGTNTDNTLSSTSVFTATPSANPSVASLSSPAPASESISPGLAAASLVAVCSSPQIPVQGTPLASVSGAKPVAELSALPGVCGEQQKGDAASSKSDVDSKPAEPTGESNVKDAKDAIGIDTKETASEPQEMREKDSASSTESKNASTVHTERTGSLQNKTEAQAQEESNVAKGKDEVEVVPQTSSQSVSQSVSQITPQLVVSHETSIASAKVVSPATLTSASSGVTCVTAKSSSQCSSSTSVVTSSSIKVTLQEPSENLSTVTSKGAPQGTSNITTKVIPMKPVSREASESTAKVTSKTGLQGSAKGEAQKSTSPGVSSAPHSVAKQVTQGTSGGGTHSSVVTTASSSSCQPSKTKPSVTTETPRPAAVKAFQHLPSGMTASSSKQFSAITSIVTKEASKESKTELGKAQDQGDSAKL